MFAVVRTGGKQYRVAPGDKIVVEKLDGEAGQRIDITDVLLAGEGSDLKSVDGLTVAAEIVAQAKGEKVVIFKKRRRHNYRRKKGHRQQHTILKIVAIGDQKSDGGSKQAKAPKKAAQPEALGDSSDTTSARGQTDVGTTANPAPEAIKPKKAAPKKAKAPSTNDDASANGAGETAE
ncbi:50S ribosomal protein L21 [Sphingomonas piscis]|uniref:Large ribosomal subunit protein bL21 n=1 Tax=Sphingomonas piscis TaxID=2714943 RepID=A0A6G7YNX6_9SPHN|nr:50S ribosomal protein L21 [Sphingomonas piscis]QIK78442.1 50S ribosomal protein L21 [Sphingomonas piscis]